MARPKKDKSQDNLNKYVNRIRTAESNRDGNYKELWSRCYKRYRNFVEQMKDKDRSNISIPYTFTQVETVIPRLVESLFAARPYVAFTGRKTGYDTNAKKMETLIDWQMNERFDIQDKFHTGLKTMVMFGTTVAYSGWKYSERNIIKKKEVPVTVTDEDGSVKPVLDEYGQPITTLKGMPHVEVDYDDPDIQFIDLGLFFVDPNAENIDDARYCGHTCFESKEFLKSMEKMGIWEIDWRKVENSNMKNEARNYRMSQVGLTNNTETSDSDDGLYRVDYYWEDDKYVVLINLSHVAKETENLYWHKRKPYVKDVYTRVPFEFYGMGLIETIEDLQDELNSERNMRIDYRKFAMRRMWKVKRSSNINKNQLVWKQGGIIDVEEMDDIQEIRVDQSVGSSYTEEGTIKRDMQDASGVQDVVMGTSGSSETATTTMSKDSNASSRFKLVISSNEKRLLVGIARLMSMMNQQLINDERMLKVTGESAFTSILPEDIQGEFDLIAAGANVEPLANKEAHKQRLVELYGLAVNDPTLQQFPMSKMKLLKKVIEAFNIKDVDDILPSEEEINALVEAQFAAMQNGNPNPMGSPQTPPTGIPSSNQNGAMQPMMEGQGLQNPIQGGQL